MTADVADLLDEILDRARPRAGLHQGEKSRDTDTAERLVLELRWEVLCLGIEGPRPGFTLGRWAAVLEAVGDHVDVMEERMGAELQAGALLARLMADALAAHIECQRLFGKDLDDRLWLRLMRAALAELYEDPEARLSKDLVVYEPAVLDVVTEGLLEVEAVRDGRADG